MVDPPAHDIVHNLVENAIGYTPEGGIIDISAGSTNAGIDSPSPTPAWNPRGRPGRVRTLLSRRQSRARRGGTGSSPSSATWHVLGEKSVSATATREAVFTVNLPVEERIDELRTKNEERKLEQRNRERGTEPTNEWTTIRERR
jgi:hypothetical protein